MSRRRWIGPCAGQTSQLRAGRGSSRFLGVMTASRFKHTLKQRTRASSCRRRSASTRQRKYSPPVGSGGHVARHLFDRVICLWPQPSIVVLAISRRGDRQLRCCPADAKCNKDVPPSHFGTCSGLPWPIWPFVLVLADWFGIEP